MKRRILVPIVLLVCSALGWSQTVTVTADAKSILAGAQSTKIKLCLSLVDVTGQTVGDAHVAGVGVIVPQQSCVTPDGSGHFSTTVYSNDSVTAGGATSTTLYRAEWLYNGSPVAGVVYQFLLADVTEDLNTKAPANVVPLVTVVPTDNVYARLDGGNQPFLAPLKVPDGSVSSPSYTFTNDPTMGLWRAGTNKIDLSINSISQAEFNNKGIATGSTDIYGFSSTVAASGTVDTAISRCSAGVLCVGASATNGDATGGISLATVNKVTITPPATAATLTIANNKTFIVNNTLTLAGTDSTTQTFQASDTIVGRATTDTLTNKTLDTAGVGNVLKINGIQITAPPGILMYGCRGTATANTSLVLSTGNCTDGTGFQTPVSAGTIKNLRCKAQTGGVNASSGVFTVRKNGAGQTTTCTFGTGTTCTDTSHTFSVTDNDLVDILYTTQLGETLAQIVCTLDRQ